MMMLMILMMVLVYELKTAVGTSVFIMTLTAFTGSVSHYVIHTKTPDILTLLFARIGARFANKASTKTLNRATGVILVLLGIIIFRRWCAG